MPLNPFFTGLLITTGVDAKTALANGGKLRVYDGLQPLDAETAITTQNLLCTLTLNATAFAASSMTGIAPNRLAVAVANPISSDPSAIGTGIAAWFRQYRADGTTGLWDGSVGVSGCDLNLSSISIVTTATVAVQSFTYSEPE